MKEKEFVTNLFWYKKDACLIGTRNAGDWCLTPVGLAHIFRRHIAKNDDSLKSIFSASAFSLEGFSVEDPLNEDIIEAIDAAYQQQIVNRLKWFGLSPTHRNKSLRLSAIIDCGFVVGRTYSFSSSKETTFIKVVFNEDSEIISCYPCLPSEPDDERLISSSQASEDYEYYAREYVRT